MKRARHRRRAQATSFHPAGRSGSTITTSAAPAASAFQSLWVYSSVCAGLALAVFIVYTPGLSHDFVNFDDPQYVVENPHVRSGLTWRGVGWALTATHAGNWHPVTWWSHMLDVELFGLNPQGHHASTVLIHLVNTLLLFTLLDRMTRQLVPSALVAALFGVHPLHVESVAWIAERKDVLSTLFALLTIQAYVSYVQTRSRSRYALALGWFVTGLATKPMLVTLPFVLLLLDFWPLRRLAWSDSGMQAGRLESAAAEYEEAVRLQGAFAEARANLGNLLARLGRTDEAEIHLREAVRLEPRDSASRYALAVALVRQGREAEAREQLEKLLREDSAYEAAREMLSQLTRGAIRPPERRR